MNRKDRSTIHSIVTQDDLQSFISSYYIPLSLSPHLSGPLEPASCSSKRTVIYTPSFSFCGVRYPIPSFKIELLKHFWIHFLQVHPLAFLRIVHFELTCAAFVGAPSVPFFRCFIV
ncbi:hypothetical protein Hanom_Chr03g00207851 [Helianthus anomalus]